MLAKFLHSRIVLKGFGTCASCALLVASVARGGASDHSQHTKVATSSRTAKAEGPRVALDLASEFASSSVNAGKVLLSFTLKDHKTGRPISPEDLLVTHEMKLHVIVFDPSLTEFRHIHPEFSKGQWKASATLDVDGSYWLWAEGKLKKDGEEFSAGSRFNIKGGKQAHKIAPSLGDVRSGEDRGSIATLSNEVFKAGTMAMPSLMFSRADGKPVKITNYLGAPAHVVAVNREGKMIHVHPMEQDGQFVLHVTFPKSGDYRLWIQFIEQSELRVVPLSVQVE